MPCWNLDRLHGCSVSRFSWFFSLIPRKHRDGIWGDDRILASSSRLNHLPFTVPSTLCAQRYWQRHKKPQTWFIHHFRLPNGRFSRGPSTLTPRLPSVTYYAVLYNKRLLDRCGRGPKTVSSYSDDWRLFLAASLDAAAWWPTKSSWTIFLYCSCSSHVWCHKTVFRHHAETCFCQKVAQNHPYCHYDRKFAM